MNAQHLAEAGASAPWAQPAAQAVLRAADTPATGPLLALLRAWRWVRARRRTPESDQAVRPTGQLTPVPPRPQ